MKDFLHIYIYQYPLSEGGLSKLHSGKPSPRQAFFKALGAGFLALGLAVSCTTGGTTRKQPISPPDPLDPVQIAFPTTESSNSDIGKLKWSAEDRFLTDHLPRLAGKKIWFVTNSSGLGRQHNKLKSRLKANGTHLLGFLALEHGIFGAEQDYQTTKKGTLPTEYSGAQNFRVLNLYKLSAAEMGRVLAEAHAVVFDVGEVGIRCYTYLTILTRILKAQSKASLTTELIVIDHANPVADLPAVGPMVAPGYRTMVSEAPIPMYHGMTIAEVAVYIQRTSAPRARLTVVLMERFHPKAAFESYEIWRPTSPNLPSLQSVLNYLGLVYLEGINISVGRGTPGPFLYIGAPYINPEDLTGHPKLKALNIEMAEVYFTPAETKFTGKFCAGIKIKAGGNIDPIELGYELIMVLFELYPNHVRWEGKGLIKPIDRLWGSATFRMAVTNRKPFAEFQKTYAAAEASWRSVRQKYYLYDRADRHQP